MMELKESCIAPPVILLLITAQRGERQKNNHSSLLYNVKKNKNCLVAKKYINERLLKYSACRSRRATFVLSVDVVTYVQVQVCDLEVVGRLAYIVGAEQLGHGCALVSCGGRLLGAHLLGRGGRRRHLEDTDAHAQRSGD